jgi:hypothetical protein
VKAGVPCIQRLKAQFLQLSSMDVSAEMSKHNTFPELLQIKNGIMKIMLIVKTVS